MNEVGRRLTGMTRSVAFGALRGEFGLKVQKLALRARFRHELNVLRRGPTPGGATSLFHLTINKAATQAVRRVLVQTALTNGLVPLKLNELAYWTGLPFLDDVGESGQSNPVGTKLLRRAVHHDGYAYLAIAGPMEWAVDQISASRTLVVVRDPIALIESDFASVRERHIMPGESKSVAFLEERQKAADLGLATFALDRLQDYQRIYEWLARALRVASVSSLLRFEDLLDNPSGELERVHFELGLETPDGLPLMADEFARAGRGTLDHPKVSDTQRERLPAEVQLQVRNALEGALDILGYRA